MAASERIKVLVVDDDEVVRYFLYKFLTLKGIEVKAVESGQEAIESAKKGKFDICILDVRMPRMDGVETLTELKKISSDSTYVMMTGYAVDDLLKKAETEGASYSIRKPFDINQIVAIVEEYKAKKVPHKPAKILVVDDEEIVLTFFQRLLKGEEYELTLVKTGSEALENIKQHDFDVVFLDIALEDINGIALYSQTRAIKPNLDVVLITGDPTAAKGYKYYNIRGCLYKPFQIEKILSVIDEVMHSKNIES